MSKTEVCPHCDADLSNNRTTGVEIWGVYDGVLFWRCPDCGGSWHRWTPNDRLRLYEAAEKYIGTPAKAEAALNAWAESMGLPSSIRTRVEIDPNVRTRHGSTFTGVRYVDGPVAIGDKVTVFESEADIEGWGTVTEIDKDKGLVYLRVDWASLRDREEGLA